MRVEERLPELLDLAVEAARAAGAILSERGGVLLRINEEEGKDVKLEADRQAEQIIRTLLKGKSDFAILGEEMGYDGSDVLTEWQWIVDPLDGTANYLHDIPACCVSIALWHGLKPVLGVIYDFNCDALYCGNVPEGWATFCDKPVTVSSVVDASKAIYGTGFPAAMNLEDQSLQDFFVRVQRYKKIRMIGSASLGIAYVAVGRFDVYEEDAGRLWDIAAGVALVEAAGGDVFFELLDAEYFLCNVKVAASPNLIT